MDITSWTRESLAWSSLLLAVGCKTDTRSQMCLSGFSDAAPAALDHVTGPEKQIILGYRGRDKREALRIGARTPPTHTSIYRPFSPFPARLRAPTASYRLSEQVMCVCTSDSSSYPVKEDANQQFCLNRAGCFTRRRYGIVGARRTAEWISTSMTREVR